MFETTGSISTGLDSSQQEFCDTESGALRLLAPAGSGKTRSLLARCKALAKRSPDENLRFVLFAFTRTARNELRERLQADPEFRQISGQLTITTLNAWGASIIRQDLNQPQIISTTHDRYFCVSKDLEPVWRQHPTIRDALEGDKKQCTPQNLFEYIEALKSLAFRHDSMKNWEDFSQHWQFLLECNMESLLQSLVEEMFCSGIIQDRRNPIEEIYEKFFPFWQQACEELYRLSKISFEDQKYWALIALSNQGTQRELFADSERFHHILVDEFQDINPLDLALLKQVSLINQAPITLTGDDDQAIFAWRGATPTYILDPDKHLGSGYRTIILETNYRSPKNIVELSQKLISHNQRRISKEVKPDLSFEARIEIHGHTRIDEAIQSTVRLVRALNENPQGGTIALISRKRSQLIPYQIAFAGENQPFYAAEDLHLFLSDAFTRLKNILELRAPSFGQGLVSKDPIQKVLILCDSFNRYPLNKRDREELRRHLIQSDPSSFEDVLRTLLRHSLASMRHSEANADDTHLREAIYAFMNAETVCDAIEVISCRFKGLHRDFIKAEDDIFYTEPPFEYLSEYARNFGSDFDSFSAALDKAASTLARNPEENVAAETDDIPPCRLHLMTALRAKGKEFDTVIILDANDGIWPSKMAKTDDDLEQERRLFYVAMTRARRSLLFVVNDMILEKRVSPSPYLSEMGLDISVGQ